MFRFEIIHESKISRARVGRIYTSHGIIETPGFVPVGTNAVVKAVDSIALEALNVQLLFCNTYHLLLHPGTDVIKAAGGLHQFMNRTSPIITDSGGFQVFSLAYGSVHDELKSRGVKKNQGSVVKITEEGVLFRSYRDGALLLLTPESSIQAQKDIGADIIIPLDELPPYHIGTQELRKSFDRTHRWEKRSLAAHRDNPLHQAMYAVIHGGVDNTLRLESTQILSREPFDGFAVGGSLGKNRKEMVNMLSSVMPHLPTDKPNHLLGIGDIESLNDCIPLGVDTFDSSHPTRCARHALLFTNQGMVKILQSVHKAAFFPIEEACVCYTCINYTRSYIHHLFKAKELTAYTLATIHNLHFMMQRMADYRQRILDDAL